MKFQLTCTGSFEDIAKIVEAVREAEAVKKASLKIDSLAASDERKGIVPADLMRRALTRQPLTKHTRTMLTAISEYEENDRYLSRTDICKRTDLSPTQLNGVLGRYGQRVKGTLGYDGTSNYFEYRWLEETSEWSYRLPDELRDVVREVLGSENTR